MKNIQNWETFNEKLEGGLINEFKYEGDQLIQKILDICDDDYTREELILKTKEELEDILTRYFSNTIEDYYR